MPGTAIRNRENTPDAPLRYHGGHADYVLGRLKADIFPFLGTVPISQIEPPELLEVIHKVEAREAYEMAHRIRSFCSQVFRYVIAAGICKRDPAADLRGALVPHTPSNMAFVPLEKLPELLRLIGEAEAAPYCRNRITRIALQLLALAFVRPCKLRKAQWSQINRPDGLWTIPAAIMKKRRPHLVPLSRQALAAIEELHQITGYGDLLFPGEGPKGLMSENTCLFALYALGYRGRMTAHGFRAVASTALNESELFEDDWIELQLAHVEENDSRRAYNHAKWLDQRREMMGWYADYLDELRKGEFVKPHLFRPQSQKREAA